MDKQAQIKELANLIAIEVGDNDVSAEQIADLVIRLGYSKDNLIPLNESELEKIFLMTEDDYVHANPLHKSRRAFLIERLMTTFGHHPMRLLPQDHKNGECYLCGKMTNMYSGSPNDWPTYLPKPEGNGKGSHYHWGCVYNKMFNNKLDKHEITQFLTGWGINQAHQLASDICDKFGK